MNTTPRIEVEEYFAKNLMLFNHIKTRAMAVASDLTIIDEVLVVKSLFKVDTYIIDHRLLAKE